MLLQKKIESLHGEVVSKFEEMNGLHDHIHTKISGVHDKIQDKASEQHGHLVNTRSQFADEMESFVTHEQWLKSQSEQDQINLVLAGENSAGRWYAPKFSIQNLF